MLKDLISMDRIKYRRMIAVYIADMKNLENPRLVCGLLLWMGSLVSKRVTVCLLLLAEIMQVSR